MFLECSLGTLANTFLDTEGQSLNFEAWFLIGSSLQIGISIWIGNTAVFPLFVGILK
jgi:hypothetical protein